MSFIESVDAWGVIACICPANIDERQQPCGDGDDRSKMIARLRPRHRSPSEQRLLIRDEQDQRQVETAVDRQDGGRDGPMCTSARPSDGGAIRVARAVCTVGSGASGRLRSAERTRHRSPSSKALSRATPPSIERFASNGVDKAANRLRIEMPGLCGSPARRCTAASSI